MTQQMGPDQWGRQPGDPLYGYDPAKVASVGAVPAGTPGGARGSDPTSYIIPNGENNTRNANLWDLPAPGQGIAENSLTAKELRFATGTSPGEPIHGDAPGGSTINSIFNPGSWVTQKAAEGLAPTGTAKALGDVGKGISSGTDTSGHPIDLGPLNGGGAAANPYANAPGAQDFNNPGLYGWGNFSQPTLDQAGYYNQVGQGYANMQAPTLQRTGVDFSGYGSGQGAAPPPPQGAPVPNGGYLIKPGTPGMQPNGAPSPTGSGPTGPTGYTTQQQPPGAPPAPIGPSGAGQTSAPPGGSSLASNMRPFGSGAPTQNADGRTTSDPDTMRSLNFPMPGGMPSPIGAGSSGTGQMPSMGAARAGAIGALPGAASSTTGSSMADAQRALLTGSPSSQQPSLGAARAGATAALPGGSSSAGTGSSMADAQRALLTGGQTPYRTGVDQQQQQGLGTPVSPTRPLVQPQRPSGQPAGAPPGGPPGMGPGGIPAVGQFSNPLFQQGQQSRGVQGQVLGGFMNPGMYNNADQGVQRQDAGQQQGLIRTLQSDLAGGAPSLAQQQLKQGTDANIATANALAASAGPQNANAASRQAAMTAATAGQQLAGSTAALRAQEYAQARGELGQATTSARGQDLTNLGMTYNNTTQQGQLASNMAIQSRAQDLAATGMSYDNAMKQAQLEEDQNKTQATLQMGQNQLNLQGQLGMYGLGQNVQDQDLASRMHYEDLMAAKYANDRGLSQNQSQFNTTTANNQLDKYVKAAGTVLSVL